MTSTINTAPTPRASALKTWWPLLLFAVLWVDLVRQLSYTWDTNEQYAYGWFVPFLALALFFRRWPTRPPSSSSGFSFPLSAFILFLALSLLPLRVILEINQDWPLITWLMTAIVVGLSLYAVFLAGGWPWVKHFAFPISFILVTVQWPYRIEHGLTQNLMQVVASLTVEILGWFNIPAFQRGNLIEISTGVLGVDEACSGIRSFQSTLMAALFLGELYLLRPPIRLLLVGTGLIAAFLLNVCRTLILTWQANAHGLSAIDKWHDPAGFAIAIACFAVLWLLAVLIKCKYSPFALRPPSSASASLSAGGEGRGEVASAVSRQSSVVSNPILPSSAVRPPPSAPWRRYAAALGLWSLLCIAATEAWYRSHEINQPPPLSWSVTLPTESPSFQVVPVSPVASKMLKSDDSLTGKWQEPDGSEWTLFLFRWNPNSMQSVISARLHRPEVCLTGAGLRQTSMSPLDYFPAGPLQIPFHKYTFETGGQQLYVFFSLWQDGEEQSGMRTLGKNDRIKWVLEGRRGMGQQTLEIICSGYPDMAAAEKAVRQRLPELVRAETHRPAVAASARGSSNNAE